MLDEARAGGGRLLLCTGEAGIGKTRLAEETAALAAARGAAVAWARSSDRDIAPPYGLWRLALPDMPGRHSGKPEPDLWSLAFGGTASRALGSDSELDRGQRFALFSAVRERLARAAEPDGLLLVLDDIQWADGPSLLLLAHLVRQLRGVRMLVLATCRPGCTSWPRRWSGAAPGPTRTGPAPCWPRRRRTRSAPMEMTDYDADEFYLRS